MIERHQGVVDSRSGIQQGTLEGTERLFVMGAERAKAGVFQTVFCSYESVFLVLHRGEKWLYLGVF